MKLPKMNALRILAISVTVISLKTEAQVVIQSDIVDASGENYAYVSNSNLAPVASGTIDYFWYNSSDLSTITGWSSASSWLGSSLKTSNFLGSQSIGVGYGGAAGLFAGDVNIASLNVSAVGKNFAAAITTSGGLLGVFKFATVLPSNATPPNPAEPVGAILTDVGASGVLVGSFNANGSFEFGGQSNAGAAYILVPEPSTGALMMIGAAGLVALRRLRKV